MKSTRYFTLNYTGFTAAASEGQAYLRLIAGEHLFYTDKRHFADPAGFQSLRIDRPLHLGTRRLADGSYWIHWLSDGETRLEPARPPLKKKLLIFFISLLLCFATAWPTFLYFSPLMLFTCGTIAMIAFVTALYFFCGLLQRGVRRCHPAMRDLQARMRQAARGDFSFCQILSSSPSLRKQALPGFTQPERFALIEGTIEASRFKQWSRGAGKTRRTYHGVEFICARRALSFSWLVQDLAQGLDPIFYRRHPPFLANGDHIVAVYQRDDNSVQALYNVNDGAAYLKSHTFHSGDQQMSRIYKVVYGIGLLLFLFTCGMIAHDMLPGWDSWKFASQALDMFSMILLVTSGFIAVFELVQMAIRHLSSQVADWLKLHHLFRQAVKDSGTGIAYRELM